MLSVLENGIIPVYKDGNKKAVNARELHEFLEVGTKFTDWIKDRIKKYDFTENEDYVHISEIRETRTGATIAEEYILTLDTAKEIAMVQNNLKGRQARKYFISVEKKFKKIVAPQCMEDVMIAQLQEMKNVRLMVEQNKQATKKLENRVDSLDCSNIDGTPQQRLNAMVKKIAFDNGLTFAQAWKDFRIAFNTAYHTNLEEKRNNYLKKNNIKNLSIPGYLTRVELIEDALRVADKMLNKAN